MTPCRAAPDSIRSGKALAGDQAVTGHQAVAEADDPHRLGRSRKIVIKAMNPAAMKPERLFETHAILPHINTVRPGTVDAPI